MWSRLRLCVPQLLLLVCVTAVCVATPSFQVVECVWGSDCTLPCIAQPKAGVRYRDFRWYKVGPSGMRGLLTQRLPDGPVLWYAGLQRPVEPRPLSLDIVLPNLTLADAGEYECLMGAPVGERDRAGRLRLRLAGITGDGVLGPEVQPDRLGFEAPPLVWLCGALVITITVLLLVALLLYVCRRTQQAGEGEEPRRGEKKAREMLMECEAPYRPFTDPQLHLHPPPSA